MIFNSFFKAYCTNLCTPISLTHTTYCSEMLQSKAGFLVTLEISTGILNKQPGSSSFHFNFLFPLTLHHEWISDCNSVMGSPAHSLELKLAALLCSNTSATIIFTV